jgi:hypothetical protein
MQAHVRADVRRAVRGKERARRLRIGRHSRSCSATGSSCCAASIGRAAGSSSRAAPSGASRGHVHGRHVRNGTARTRSYWRCGGCAATRTRAGCGAASRGANAGLSSRSRRQARRKRRARSGGHHGTRRNALSWRHRLGATCCEQRIHIEAQRSDHRPHACRCGMTRAPGHPSSQAYAHVAQRLSPLAHDPAASSRKDPAAAEAKFAPSSRRVCAELSRFEKRKKPEKTGSENF